MNPKQMAMDFADSVLALVPQLIFATIEQRRNHACWWSLYYRKRLDMCARIMRPWWRMRLRKASAQCSANKEMAESCALASARVRMDGAA